MAATARKGARGAGEEYDDIILLDGDDDEGGGGAGPGSPPPEGGNENQPEPQYFKRSLETLEELAKVLACVKCGKLSGRRIYTLGACTHKYCDKCVTSAAGRPCVTCQAAAYPKDAKPDLFSTSILAEIPGIYLAITKLEREKTMKPVPEGNGNVGNCDKKGEEDEEGRPLSLSSPGGGEDKSVLKEDDGIISVDLKSNHPRRPFTPPKENSMKMVSGEDDDDAGMGMEVDMPADFGGGEEHANGHIDKQEVFAAELDEEVFENTPASKMIPTTPDPDVMEETPQHKASASVTSLSFGRKGRSAGGSGNGSSGMGRKVQPKVLVMESQEKSKDKEVDTSKSSKTTIDTTVEVIFPKSSTSTGGKKVVDEDETLFSEEELFRSQTSPSVERRDLPVLTPQVPKQLPANESVKPPGTGRKQSEEAVKSEKAEADTGGGKDKKNKSPLNKRKVQPKKICVWSSSEEDEPDPPSLTQHGKKITITSHVEPAKPKSNKPEEKATTSKPTAEMSAPAPKPKTLQGNKNKMEVTTPRNTTLDDLFRSQTSDDDGKTIPILTPHPPGKVAAENAKKRKQSESLDSSVISDNLDPVPEDNKPKRKFFTSSRKRNSEEQKPPPLTPYLKSVVKVKTPTTTPKIMKETAKAKTLFTSVKGQPKSTPTPKLNKTKTEKSPSPAVPATRTTKSRAAKSKLSVSISSSSPEDALLDYEFEATPPPTEGGSSRKRRRISIPASASNRNNTSSVSLQGGDGIAKDKEKRNAKGETALCIACRAGQLSKVKELVGGGANVNATDYAGWTPLHEAIFGKAIGKEKESIIRLLCENGCNINVVGGPDDDTPLHSAVHCPESIVELLLELGASPNIRNSKGQLAVDLAFNDVIIKMLNEKTNRGTVGQVAEASSTSSSSSNYDSALTTAHASEEDPAVIQVMLKKAILYFNYEVDADVMDKVKNNLKLKVSDKLISKVTHIVHHTTEKSGTTIRVPFSMEYLFGLAHGMWQVGHEWIEKSVQESNCLSPTAFEVSGCSTDMNGAALKYPGRARMNKEKGNPGLLDGFSFYLYKTCGYSSSESQEDSAGSAGLLKLGKRELSALIQAAGGKITNREPNPETVDPLEAPPRFHANQDSSSQSPFVLTSHIILYDEMSAPPKEKLYQMEHVKTLRSDWVIESISKFRLEEPAKFL